VPLFKKLFRNRRSDDYNAGIALYNEGRYEEAIAHFESAVADAPETSTTYRLGVFYAAEAHAHLGRALLKAERYAEARAHFEKAIVETPNFPDLQYSLGVAVFMLGEVEGSLPCFERALEINPDYVEARCFLAVALHELDREPEARDHLREVTQRRSEIPIQINPFLLVKLKEREPILPEIAPVLELLDSAEDFREVYTEGITQFNLGQYGLAADLLGRAVAMKPHYADLQCQLGLARLQSDHLEEAVAAFKAALAVNPRFLEAGYYLGAALLRLQRYREAEEALEYARELSDESPDVLFQLAQCKFQLGKLGEADALLGTVLERRPESAQALYLRGLVRCREGGEGGIGLLKAALRADPHLHAASMDLALMHMQRGDWRDAESLFQRLADQRPDDAALHSFLGRARLEQGRYDEALDCFSQALAGDPGNLYALKGRLRCEINLGRLGKARALLAEALERCPDYPDLRCLMAELHLRAGDYPAAEADFRRALAGAPDYLEARLGLALALRNQARAEEAASILDDLAARHPDRPELRRLLSRSFGELDGP